MDLSEAFQQAANMVKDLPSNLQPTAFQLAVEDLLGRTGRGRRRRSTTPAKRASKRAAPKTAGRRTRRVGGQSALRELAEGAFFNSPRTVKDIINHLRTTRALTLKSADLTSPIATLTREGVLERERNAEHVFEYRLPKA